VYRFTVHRIVWMVALAGVAPPVVIAHERDPESAAVAVRAVAVRAACRATVNAHVSILKTAGSFRSIAM